MPIATVGAEEPVGTAHGVAVHLQRTVLLPGAATEHHDGPPRHAVITSYRPNEVRIEVDAGAPGYLVLTDPWFPGWKCRVAGEEVEVMQGDFAFRAVAVPAEACEVVFRFDPAAVRWGWWINGGALGVVAVGLLAGALRRFRRLS
ncbi:hypothetical protein AYO40_02370 [Planctomycetaceae bacterium SCGC AG-212-D15]|nr:hypothetical protein AYO40_02370 [Planctomycetaceae bacterium SCGC AG-212-D15]